MNNSSSTVPKWWFFVKDQKLYLKTSKDSDAAIVGTVEIGEIEAHVKVLTEKREVSLFLFIWPFKTI